MPSEQPDRLLWPPSCSLSPWTLHSSQFSPLDPKFEILPQLSSFPRGLKLRSFLSPCSNEVIHRVTKIMCTHIRIYLLWTPTNLNLYNPSWYFLCARHCPTHFICINSVTLHNNPVYRGGYWGTEGLRHLCKDTQLVSGRVRIEPRALTNSFPLL